MTVKNLIERLSQMPQDSIVTVRGYEGGVNEVNNISAVKLHLNSNSKWYYGKHEIITDTDGWTNLVDGVHLSA